VPKQTSTPASWNIEPAWQDHPIIKLYCSFKAAADSDGEMISVGRQSHVHKVVTDHGIFFVKQYFQATGISAWFGYSRCEVEIRNIKRFEALGIRCGNLVAHGIERKNGRTQRGILITENVDNSHDLQWIAENATAFKDQTWRHKIIDKVALIARQLHQTNFCHNDFQWRNILVIEETEPTIALIDCPFGRRFNWPFFDYRRIKDLANLDEQARLHLSRSDRLRFFKKYRHISKLNASDKQMIRIMLARYPNPPRQQIR
jgi:tRNA A-37 threonylcarbamoyl transferase component Bud32|tara:strand:+ start:966 stop:1742 length:777 start_codon:yes stop_codon:yes gene_type:complete